MCPHVIRGGPSANLLPGPAVPGRAADIARHQMRVGIPESMKSQHPRQYARKGGAPITRNSPAIADTCERAEPAALGVRICTPRPRPPYGFLNDAFGDDWQLLVLVLAQATQPIQCFSFSSAAAAHYDANRALDHSTAAQGDLQLAC